MTAVFWIVYIFSTSITVFIFSSIVSIRAYRWLRSRCGSRCGSRSWCWCWCWIWLSRTSAITSAAHGGGIKVSIGMTAIFWIVYIFSTSITVFVFSSIVSVCAYRWLRSWCGSWCGSWSGSWSSIARIGAYVA